MILADAGGEVQFINPAAEILFGRLSEDLAGHPPDQDLFPESLRRTGRRRPGRPR